MIACWIGLEATYKMANVTLDLTGLRCPIPILKTKKAMRDLKKGDVVEVLANDPGAKEDFETYCKVSGHAMQETSERGGVYRFVILHMG